MKSESEPWPSTVLPRPHGVRLSPGLTVNGIEEGDADALLVHADPSSPHYRQIRFPAPAMEGLRAGAST
ncbi:hypothetical protein [Streptomyces sp. NPDC016845]|uniref:hypothetical protein n=1 Tax=Streptomyces sp. NPDC016845 TaxID=3364972 RepID=UPI0037B07799